jgi:hypothetical protein
MYSTEFTYLCILSDVCLARDSSLPLWYAEMLLGQDIVIVSKIYEASRWRFSTFHGHVKTSLRPGVKLCRLCEVKISAMIYILAEGKSWRSHGLTSSNPSSHIRVRDLKPHITGNTGKSVRMMPYFLHNTLIRMHSAYRNNVLTTYVRLYSVLIFIRLQLLVLISIFTWLSDYRWGLDW